MSRCDKPGEKLKKDQSAITVGNVEGETEQEGVPQEKRGQEHVDEYDE